MSQGSTTSNRPGTSTGRPGETAEQASHDLMQHLASYCQENPTQAALWCLGIGFVLGWKLKPW
jgi:ElaB/YqjD/DUF883 family membrane-anchored ribosome-binding protein